MIKKPLYLKFTDRSEADTALANCRHPIEIDVIYNDGEVYDEGK